MPGSSVVVNVNGRLCGEADAVVSVFDHGFQYGEGVYEVLRTYGRRPFLFAPHARRLRASAAMIALEVPFTDAELLARIQATLCAAPDLAEAYVRILLTRGVGPLTYDPRVCPEPTIVIVVKALPPISAEAHERGVAITLVDVVRNHPQSVNPLIKSNNLLNNALAAQQAIRRGAFEALMKNYRGEICECSQSNVFVVSAGRLRTPPLDAGLLAGVTRAFVLDLAGQAGLGAREETILEEDVRRADEVFMTSTTKEIVPVVRLDDVTIGVGAPGPVTRRLQAAFRERTAAFAAGTGQQTGGESS
jgi:branched-chain amino acid aminotransferase